MYKRIVVAICALAFSCGVAMAQVRPPPPPPAPPPSGSSVQSNVEHGGHKWKVTGESIVQFQGGAIACSAIVNIGDSQLTAWTLAREITPLEAVDNSARCLLLPAVAVSIWSRLVGINDNACSHDVARRALRENNSAQARQELLWRDGSWERRQAKFLQQYHDCYRDKEPPVVKKKFKKRKKVVFRGRKLTS